MGKCVDGELRVSCSYDPVLAIHKRRRGRNGVMIQTRLDPKSDGIAIRNFKTCAESRSDLKSQSVFGKSVCEVKLKTWKSCPT